MSLAALVNHCRTQAASHARGFDRQKLANGVCESDKSGQESAAGEFLFTSHETRAFPMRAFGQRVPPVLVVASEAQF